LDLGVLAERKAEGRHRVSVVLPSFNEAATIGGVVEEIGRLSGHLVDDLLVVDGGSTDRTVEIATDMGATVHQDRELLPELGKALGKGDALWRSLAIVPGDIVAFVDTDIRNPHPRFVYGLLAPLLTEPRVQLVKAFYDRPLEVGETLQPSGGGRVTELMARPLLNLLWPELAWLVQPLSGEYAGRTAHLRAIPFFTGYGVELGMLLDTLRRNGPDALAQVDVSERIHRNQSLDSLSRMAFGILQVAARRLADDGRLPDGGGLPTTYTQFLRGTEGAVTPSTREVEVVERPPLDEYVTGASAG
jgi:glucosyl-3-phosphoglycerate synthase